MRLVGMTSVSRLHGRERVRCAPLAGARRMHRRLPLIAILCALATPVLAAGPSLVVDGHIDPAEGAGAGHISDFRLTQPLSRAPTPYPTESWILATPQGLAVAFRNIQPAN